VTNIFADLNNSNSIEVTTGTLGFGKTFTQNASATLKIRISSGGFDSYAITQSATLDGTLEISLEGGYEPNLGQTFQIMTFASRTGTFATVNGLAIVSGRKFAITYEVDKVVLEVVTDP